MLGWLLQVFHAVVSKSKRDAAAGGRCGFDLGGIPQNLSFSVFFVRPELFHFKKNVLRYISFSPSLCLKNTNQLKD